MKRPLSVLLILFALSACEAATGEAGQPPAAKADSRMSRTDQAQPANPSTPAFSSTHLPDNPLEALGLLTPAGKASLRQVLLARDAAQVTDPLLRRQLDYVMPFLRGQYAAMLRPEVARSSQHPPGAREVSLSGYDGLSLKASYVPAAKATKRAVIVIHGYGSHRDSAWVKYQFLHADYNLLLLDLRGHNGQGGDISLGVHEARDLQPAIRWLAGQGQQSFALVGESLGAAVAITGGTLWASSPDQSRFPLKGVWSDAAYADLSHAIGERATRRLAFEAPGLEQGSLQGLSTLVTEAFLAWLARDTGVADVEAAAAPVRHLPALLRHAAYAQVHSREDDQTSYANAELLEAAAKAVPGADARFWATVGDHADSWRQTSYAPRLKEFLSHAFARGGD